MTGKIPFILRLDAGYVLGARVRRTQCEHIKTATFKVAEQPLVHTRVDIVSSHVKQAVYTQGGAVTEKVADAVKERLFEAPPSKDDAQSQSVNAGQVNVRPVGENS